MSELAKKEEKRAEPQAGAFVDAPFILAMFWVNIAVFVGEIFVTAAQTDGESTSFAMRGLSALLDIPSHVGMMFGANYASATLYDGRIDTLLAACFLHGSIWHIGFNLMALRAIGPDLERIVGTGRTALLYVGAGIVSMMFSTLEGWAFQQERIGVGASGAICGLIGAALIVGYRTAGWQSPLVRQTVRWLGTIFFIGFAVKLAHVANFDNAAHLGGALAGAVIALLWERGAEKPLARTVGIGLAAGVLVAALVAVVIRDQRDPFASLTMAERVQTAQRAARDGDCTKAWSAALSARRVARRDPATLHAIYLVRSACGIPDEA
ncbi:MAG: rhomboid family intramembrane serine protease [Polyangiaceae bacterium]